MKPKMSFWAAIIVVLAFAGGALSAGFIPRANAQAPTVTLPPIFENGAKLIGPTGSVEIHEIEGGWIRVKSLSALAKPNEELWMYVPGLPGAWTVDTEAMNAKPK